MTVSKSVLTIASLGMALLFGGGVYLAMNFSAIAKHVAQQVVSETLGVKVTIGSVQVSLQDKAVTVSNVKVGNPSGYDMPYAATIQTIYMKAQTLSQVMLRFNDIAVTGSEVYLEVHQNGTNLTDIKKNVDSKAAKGDRAAQQIKVIIEKMRIEKLRVNPSILIANMAKLQPITVPDIILTGIGVKENGVLAHEAIAQIWTDIVKRVNREASQAGFYQGLSPEVLQDMKATQVQQFKDKVSEDVDKAADKIKGLFGHSND